MSFGSISKWLHEHNVKSPTGKEHWSRETINKLLKNEKYTGDVLLQKTFVEDVFAKKQRINKGERSRFLIEAHHPAVISCKMFKAVQVVCNRRK